MAQKIIGHWKRLTIGLTAAKSPEWLTLIIISVSRDCWKPSAIKNLPESIVLINDFPEVLETENSDRAKNWLDVPIMLRSIFCPNRRIG